MFGCIGVFVILVYFVYVDWLIKLFCGQLLLLLLLLIWDWLCVTIMWNPRAGWIWKTLSVQCVIQIVCWHAWLIHSSLLYFILLSCKTDARKLLMCFLFWVNAFVLLAEMVYAATNGWTRCVHVMLSCVWYSIRSFQRCFVLFVISRS